MAALDWSQCPAAWVFKDTRMPVSIVFENLESGASIDEITEWFHVTREQIVAVLEFAARSARIGTAPELPACHLGAMGELHRRVIYDDGILPNEP